VYTTRKESREDSRCPPERVHNVAYVIAASPTSPVFIAIVRKNATTKKTIDNGYSIPIPSKSKRTPDTTGPTIAHDSYLAYRMF
jgi:hypothetical protein